MRATPQQHPQHRPGAHPARQEKRLRQWEHRPQPERPVFPEPDPPIYKPLG